MSAYPEWKENFFCNSASTQGNYETVSFIGAKFCRLKIDITKEKKIKNLSIMMYI